MSLHVRVALVLTVLTGLTVMHPRMCFSEAPEWYSDLDPPGLTPKLSAPEVFSESDYTEHVYRILPGRATCVFDRYADQGYPQGEIFISEFVDGSWTGPELFDVFAEYDFVFLPTISPDGERWFFTSPPTEPPGGAQGRIPLFYIEKNDGGWGKPQYVGSTYMCPRPLTVRCSSTWKAEMGAVRRSGSL